MRVKDNRSINTGKLESESDHAIRSLSPSDTQQHKRILVVDDNSDIALTLRIGLKNSDPTMQVYCFDNPVIFIPLYHKHVCDFLGNGNNK